MLSTLVLIVLASMGGWDILRRLLPWKLPVVASKVGSAAIGWVLYTQASTSIIMALCVPGAVLLVSRLIAPEPHTPWGQIVSDLVSAARNKRGMQQAVAPERRLGSRIPTL